MKEQSQEQNTNDIEKAREALHATKHVFLAVKLAYEKADKALFAQEDALCLAEKAFIEIDDAYQAAEADYRDAQAAWKRLLSKNTKREREKGENQK